MSLCFHLPEPNLRRSHKSAPSAGPALSPRWFFQHQAFLRNSNFIVIIKYWTIRQNIKITDTRVPLHSAPKQQFAQFCTNTTNSSSQQSPYQGPELPCLQSMWKVFQVIFKAARLVWKVQRGQYSGCKLGENIIEKSHHGQKIQFTECAWEFT